MRGGNTETRGKIMGLFSDNEKNRIAGRHHRDQTDAIVPQRLRRLAARARDNSDSRNARIYTKRAERLERESGQR